MQNIAYVNTVSDALLKARRTLSAMDAFPFDLPETLETAHAIQQRSSDLWEDNIVGWKVGGVPLSYQEAFQATRLAGPIFAKSVKYCADGEVIDMPAYPDGFVAIEPEYVIRLGKLDNLPRRELTLADVSPLITNIYIGIEIASSPLLPINDLGPAAIVSDFGNNGGLVIGEEIKNIDDFDFTQSVVTTEIDGHVVGTCPAKAGDNGPLGAVLFLLNHLRDYKLEMPEGLLVSTGAVTGVHDTHIGTTSDIVFEGLGKMTVKLVPHT